MSGPRYRVCMVNPALLASVDALPVEDQIELVEHINGRLSAVTTISDGDKALIESRAHDANPSHWSSVEDFDKRIRTRLA